ncbi:hypothetical protein NA57DRAFT_78938 [Rhizodiscina lignyota]|uniref:Uncharacterized protein n=1 Tax=Rhizodiscina lignyota TaxID=1504668 RepID=A0A9P4ICS7_9PEZI|nr:hypothetical protein NA57DRAFT_78938 [Rhizodiscina lignyota]
MATFAAHDNVRDSFTPFLFRFSTEIRQHIYDFVFDRETLDSSDMLKKNESNEPRSLYLSLGGHSNSKQFFYYLHINRKIRADMIEQVLPRLTLTAEIEELVCVLQLLTGGMRSNICRLRLIGNFGDSDSYSCIKNRREECKERSLTLKTAQHGEKETDARYMGMKDMLHISRGLSNLSHLILRPSLFGIGDYEYNLDEELDKILGYILDYRLLECLLELRGLRSFEIDRSGYENFIELECKIDKGCDCCVKIMEEVKNKRRILEAAEKRVREVVVTNKPMTF